MKQGIRMIRPTQQKQTRAGPGKLRPESEPLLRKILKLAPLERYVFVMSLLEGYSSQDCSILLGCSRQAVVNVRDRALEHLADTAEIVAMHGKKLQGAYTPVSH